MCSTADLVAASSIVDDGAHGVRKAAADCSLDEVDRFGCSVAEFVHQHWRQFGTGPTWRETFSSPAIEELLTEIGVRRSRHEMQLLMIRAAGRLWIISTDQHRSLCAGPRFFGAHGHSRESADSFGRLIAHAVGNFRYRMQRSPAVGYLARTVRDAQGRKPFQRPADLRAQLPWLAAAGWIRLDNGEIRSGPTADLEKRKRAEAKRNRRALASGRSQHAEASSPIEQTLPPALLHITARTIQPVPR